MSAGRLGLSGGTATRALLIGSGAAADGEHRTPDEVGLLVALRGASLLPGAPASRRPKAWMTRSTLGWVFAPEVTAFIFVRAKAQLATEHVRFCALRFLKSLHGAALNLVREQAGRHFQEVQEKGLVRRDHMLHVCRLVGVAQAGEVAAQELFHLLDCGCVLGASHGATGRLRRSGWQRRKLAAEERKSQTNTG